MLKNITLSASEGIIKKAREKARSEQTTLNAMFRQWLNQYINSDFRANEYDQFMKSLKYVKPGKRFRR